MAHRYHPHTGPGQREVEVAYARAMARCHALQAKSELLRRHIAEAEQIARVAGIFDERSWFTRPGETDSRAVGVGRLRLAPAEV